MALGLGLGACTAPSTKAPARPTGANRPVVALSAKPSTSPGPGASLAPLLASADPLASPTPLVGTKLKLPGRLGFALPTALVGAQAQRRLTGEDGLVAPVGTELLALADGRIVSNNSGSIVSNNSGSIISNNSGGLISDQGGGLISDQGGGLQASNPGAFRVAGRGLMQAADEVARDGTATAPVKNPITDPRMRLWLMLALVDLNDQLLNGFVKAGPRLGEWRRFPAGQGDILPMPLDLPLLTDSLVGFNQKLKGWHFAGHLSLNGPEARLRILFLPSAKAPLPEGLPILDLQSSGAEAVAQCRFLPELEQSFGFSNTAGGIRISQGPFGRELESVVAETGATNPSPISLAALLNPDRIENTRRLIRLKQLAPRRSMALLASSALHIQNNGRFRQKHNLLAMGYDPEQREGGGLALLRRESGGPLGPQEPLLWDLPFGKISTGALPIFPFYLLPEGIYSQVAPPELQALVPPFSPSDDALTPPVPSVGEDPSLDPALRPAALSPELLAAPETP